MARILPDAGNAPKAGARPEAGAGVPPRRPAPSGFRLTRLFWPALCLAQLGVLGYFYYRHYVAPQKGQPDPVEERKVDPLAAAGLKPGDTPTLDRGDDLAREGRYDLALLVYQAASKDAAGDLLHALTYRSGLCLESLGRSEGALKAYQDVAEARADDPSAVAAADLGRARVFLRQAKYGDARNLLSPLFLRSAQPEWKGRPYLADTSYLLALSLALETGRGERPGPLNDALADYTARDWHVDQALDWITPSLVGRAAEAGKAAPAKPEGTDAAKVKDFLNVRPAPSVSESEVVSARIPPESGISVSEFLEKRLAESTRRKVEWSAQALKIAKEQTTNLNIDSIPLPDVVIALTTRHGLLATMPEGRILVTTEKEITEKERTAFLSSSAQTFLTHALKAHPGHGLSVAARMELAALDVRAGRLEEAALRYEAITSDARRAPVQVEANYNLGIVRQRQDQPATARSAFYRVVDQAAGQDMTALAYLQIGRSHLREGEPDQAVTPLRRTLSTAPTGATRPCATMSLAIAYLLTDGPHLAEAVLLDNKDAVLVEPYRTPAIFLDAYSRYLQVGKGKPASRSASDVLASLWALPQQTAPADDRVMGAAGTLLAGRAYRDLGQVNEMVHLYQKSITGLKGPIADEMALTLAEEFFKHDKRESAAKLYTTLAKGPVPRLASVARLRLAEIALQEKRSDETLTLCRALLKEKMDLNKTVVLGLMGQAYELKGDHLRAARCFAGDVPE